MSASAENLRHACASASELARQVWDALTPAHRSEMQWFYGRLPEPRTLGGWEGTETTRQQLVAVGLLAGRWEPSPWGAFVFAVGGAS